MKHMVPHRSLPLQLVALATISLLCGCSLEALETGESDPGGAGGVGGEGGSGPADCPAGQIVGPDGSCMAVGIQGCAEIFLEDDGLCHPRMDKCPPGTIPDFDEGCVPVGIQGCAEVFVEDDGLCHPRMDKCPAGTFAAPLRGCVPIDGPEGCGTGTWGHIADGPNTLWVDPAYAAGDGLGTQAQPFTTLAEAIDAAAPGGRVALAAGDYPEGLDLYEPVEIVGRCPSLVTISGTQQAPWALTCFAVSEAVIQAKGVDGLILRNLALRGDGYGLLAVASRVELEGVHIHETMGCGLYAAYGSLVTMSRSLLEHTRSVPVEPLSSGTAMRFDDDSHLHLRDSALYGNRYTALWSWDGSFDVEGVLIENNLGGYGSLDRAIWMVRDQTSVFRSSALVDNCGLAIELDSGDLVLQDSIIEGTRLCADGAEGEAIAVIYPHAWLDMSGCALLNNPGGVQVWDGAGEVRSNLIQGNPGKGVSLRAGEIALFDNAVVRNERAGIACSDTAPGLHVEGNLVERNGVAEPTTSFFSSADGIVVGAADDVLLRHNAAVDNYGAGIRLQSTSARLEHNLVEGTRATDAFMYRTGEGLHGHGEGTRLVVDGLAALDNQARGLWLQDTQEPITVRRSFITRTQPRPADGELGCGAVLEAVAHPDTLLEELQIADNQLAAMLVHSSTVTLRASELADTREGSFTGLVCPSRPCSWNKVSVYGGIADGFIAASSEVLLDGVDVAGCSRAGVLAHATAGALRNVTSNHNGFGLVLQGSPQPEVLTDSCVFDPNADQDVLTDSDLAIPDSSSARPESPDP